MSERCSPNLHRWNWDVCVLCGCRRRDAAKDEVQQIIVKLRELAPRFRGSGETASDATYNRMLRHADLLERLIQ